MMNRIFCLFGSAMIIWFNWFIGLMSWVFPNGPEDWDSIPSQVIPTTQKMVLYTTLLNIQLFNARMKGKVE